jgi:hypothetical protein
MVTSTFHVSKVTDRRAAATLGLVALALWGCARPEQSLAPTCLAGAPGQPGLDSALAVHRRHTMELMAIPGVVGTAVGVNADCRAVITIFTKQGGVAGLPAMLEGIPVEAKVTGDFVAQSS